VRETRRDTRSISR